MSDTERAMDEQAVLGLGQPADRTRFPPRGGPLVLLVTVALAGCGGSSKNDANDTSSVVEGSATADYVKFDRKVASGKYAAAKVSGTVAKPGGILLSIKGTPPQKAQMSWALTCSKGSGAGSEAGQRTLRTPVSLVLKEPMKDNDSCRVSADAHLVGSGEIIVKLANRPR